MIPKNKDGLNRLSNAREDQKALLGHLMYTAQVVASKSYKCTKHKTACTRLHFATYNALKGKGLGTNASLLTCSMLLSTTEAFADNVIILQFTSIHLMVLFLFVFLFFSTAWWVPRGDK